LLKDCDLILVMETAHRTWIETRMPELAGRVYLLGHWRGLEISDPVNGSRAEFERTARNMERCLADWSEHTRACATSTAATVAGTAV
jgi:protein-tyrosine-phosphatase